eukprot:gene15738-21305_t
MSKGFGNNKDSKASSTSSTKKVKETTKITKAEIKTLNQEKSIPFGPRKVTDTTINNYCPLFGANDYDNNRIKVVHADPPVFEIPHFFSDELCDTYIQRADSVGKMYNSQTFSIDYSTKRTSTTWYLHYKDVPELIHHANKLTNIPITHFEEPQIVRYELGQQFSWHYDAIPQKLNTNGGQRIVTLIVYLNNMNKND